MRLQHSLLTQDLNTIAQIFYANTHYQYQKHGFTPKLFTYFLIDNPISFDIITGSKYKVREE